jgi:ABC-2 type transport system permease protein/sodium transport system permease protein
VLVTGLLFGLFHVLSPSSLMPERFLPSTFLGFVLGWVCFRSSSILPGMLVHATHNALLMFMVQHHDKLAAHGWDPQQSGHVPGPWLLGCGAVVLGACAVLYLATRGATPRPSQTD